MRLGFFPSVEAALWLGTALRLGAVVAAAWRRIMCAVGAGTVATA